MKKLLFIAALATVAVSCGNKDDGINTGGSIYLVGLHWDERNAKDYATFDEANELAASLGKRLPTVEEFEQLCELPSVWDNDKKGFWFAENENDFKNVEKSLFLNAKGGRNTDGDMVAVDRSCRYWSSIVSDDTLAYGVGLDTIQLYISTLYKTVGMSARCVKD